MRKLLLFLGLGVSLVHAGDAIPSAPISPAPISPVPDAITQTLLQRPHVRPGGRNLWRISLTTLVVSNALDVQSSWGKHELNSTLASPSGTFGAQGALLKLGFQGGLAGVEYLLTRHHPSPRLYRTLAIINFGASAGIAGVAAHNYTVAPPGH